jgi:hypothetical protein
MVGHLQRILLREQRSFLRRDRGAWGEHLRRVRGFLGAGLEEADPGRPVLVLGAGSGLELPWAKAPRTTFGWDGDPASRMRTLFRHGRWAPWVFGDFTGAFGPLLAAAERSARESWSGRRRSLEAAWARLIALLPALPVDSRPLRGWIQGHRPGAILAANCMGQFAPLAQRIVERAFAPQDPWEPDPDRVDALAQALDRWTARLVEHFLAVLAESDADLRLVHDRAVFGGGDAPALGDFTLRWKEQLRATGTLELWDPLAGVDVLERLSGRPWVSGERWLWPVGEGQLHLVEAVAVRGAPAHEASGIESGIP